MSRSLLVLLTFAILAPVGLAQELPPPRDPANNDTDWLLLPGPAAIPPQNGPQLQPQNAAPLPPQNVQQQAPAPAVGAQPAKKTAEELNALYAARRRLQIERKQAQIDRMNQFKAARAAEEQKLYQDWHERYLADAPVRVEYYRALAASYQSQPLVPYYGYGAPYFYSAGPAVVLPPVYGPVVASPIYCGPVTCGGTFFSWGW